MAARLARNRRRDEPFAAPLLDVPLLLPWVWKLIVMHL
jgi:hypothetical protein